MAISPFSDASPATLPVPPAIPAHFALPAPASMESPTTSTDQFALSLAPHTNLEIYPTSNATIAPTNAPPASEGSILNASPARRTIATIISLSLEPPFAIIPVLMVSIRILLISNVKFVIVDA
jgi:hypothetical protein